MHPTPCIVIAVFDHWSFRNNHSKPMFPKLFFRSFHGNCDRMFNQLFKLLSYQTRRFESPFLSLSLSLTLALTPPMYKRPTALSLFLFLLYTTITTSASASRRSPDDASSTTKTSKNQPTLTRPRQPPLLGGGSIAGVGGGVNPSPKGKKG